MAARRRGAGVPCSVPCGRAERRRGHRVPGEPQWRGDLLDRRLDVEQAARATAERQAQAAAAQRAELAAELDELAAAGPIRAWRLRRQLRQAATSS